MERAALCCLWIVGSGQEGQPAASLRDWSPGRPAVHSLTFQCSVCVCVFSVVLFCTTSVLYLDRSGEAVDSRRDPGLSSEQREGRPVL